MDRREVAAALAYTGRLDSRTPLADPAEVRERVAQWHELLSDVPLVVDQDWDVRRVIRDHVLASPYPILPVDIARAWHAFSRERLQRHTDPTPAADPDDPAAWRAELLAHRRAVATGQAAPSSHRQLTSGGPHRNVAARLGTVGSYLPPAVRTELAPYRPARAARDATVSAGRPDALSVRCAWCHAPEGEPCRSRRVGLDGHARGNAPRVTPHPSRVDLAARKTASPATEAA
ncbi:hypothetical protein ABZ921_33655 [Streptomyces atriruber]|uniref:DNA-binding phage zinc finger domain-containing protein n=1 Tax=Streptomyces atriruber TaxID=545121 RepID=A0ABV3BX36_9ACTN